MSNAALEAHLRDHPHDGPSWLVYGDCLLERGDVRGELIRLEDEKALRERTRRDTGTLEKKIASLEKKHREVWQGLAPRGAEIAWRNGFVVGVDMVYEEEALAGLAGFLGTPEARFFTSLRIRGPRAEETEEMWDEESEFTPEPLLPAADVAALDLRRVRSLAIPYALIGADGARALAACALPELASLDLRYDHLDDEAIEALCASPHLGGLASLCLAGNVFAHGGAVALARASLGRLQTLDLRYNRIGVEGAAALAASPNVRGLASLLVFRADIGDEGARALADSTELPLPIRRFWKGQ
jgi:uncharacterized protein (TIGR02996 family)